jgi:hypothetical protein
MPSRVIPGWWNGRHAASRSLCSIEHEGSNLSSGTRRMWWNGRHACFRSMCRKWRKGSNPFIRTTIVIVGAWRKWKPHLT